MDTSSAVAAYMSQRKPQEELQTSYMLGAESNPDAEAQYRRLAREAGLPVDTVRNNEKAVQRQVSAPNFSELATKFPSTSAYLSNLENSRVAHDDVGGLTEVEKAIRSFIDGGAMKRGAPGKTGNDKALQFLSNTGSAGFSGLQRASAGVVGVAQAPFDMLAPALDPLTGTVLPENPLRRAAAGMSAYRQRIEAQSKANMPKADGILEGGYYSGIGSLASNLAAMPLALLPGGQGAALAGMTAPVGGGAYGEARDKGLNPGQAAVYGGSQAVIEYATEKLPLSKLIGDVKAGTPFFKTLAKQIALEVPGEQLATVLQDLNEWAALNPTKPFKSYLEDRPGAAAQTLIATIVGAGGQVAVMKAVQNVLDKTGDASLKTTRAEEAAAGAQNIVKAVAATKLVTRDAESFQQFVNQVAEDSDTPTELFIDADTLTNTLNQAGITMERLQMVAPAVAAQLRAASFVPGADIRVPVAEFAAAGADITTPLIDHLRETPDAMSRAEAQEYLKTEGDRIQADVETELGKMGSSIAARQDLDKATARFEAELTSAGRFRPEVNKAYAGMMGNFYATQAARAGMPLEEFLNKYQLRVTGKTGQGAQTLEQERADQTASPEFRNWFGDSKVVDEAGKPQVLYHGTAKAFTKINMKKGAQGLFWMTSDKAAIEAGEVGAQGSGAIMDLYATIKNPAGWKEYEQKSIGELKRDGYDGIILPDSDGSRTVVVFEPTQVKSASRNKGGFDPANKSILNQGPAQAGRAQAATNSIATTVERAQAAVADFLGRDTLPNELGRVVTATAADIKATWEPLIGRNVQMESEGDAGAAQAFYDPASKTVFLIADNIRAGDEAAVLAHELMHKHGQAALGKAGWDKLHGVINTWVNAPEDSDERAVYQYASSKVRAVGEQLSSQEMFPYAVEAALKMGVQPSKKAKAGTVSRWLNDVQGAMKTAWDKVTGKPEAFDTQDLVNLAYGIAQMENPALAPANRGLTAINSGAEQAALEAISASDELFALPRSEQDTVEGITADNDPAIKVKKTQDAAGRTDYQLTLPNGKTANLIVRPFNPYATEEAPTVYGYDLADGEMTNLVLERPGTNPDDVGAVDDVWLDASNLDSGGFGAVLYNIAATYAHNTGRKFIGDPAGLSDDALRRRTEQMLSSALKFGTTEHLAPHPRQVRGDKALGIPALKWTYGDDLGNIKALAETSLANYTDVNPVTFEPSTGRFLDSEGVELDDDALRQIAEVGPGREAGAGLTTLKRNAVLAALVREEGGIGSGSGQRDGLLGRLVDVAGQSPASARGLFYSRDGSLNQSAVDQTATPQFKKWFGDSKVVDDAGKPLPVYHGSTSKFTAFDPEKRGSATGAKSAAEGFFFASKKSTADTYASDVFKRSRKARADLDSARADIARLTGEDADHGSSLFFQGKFDGSEKEAAIERAIEKKQDAERRMESEADDYFGGAPRRAKNGQVVEAFLSLQNPLVHDQKGAESRDARFSDLIAQAKAAGNDGVIIRNTMDDGSRTKAEDPTTDVFIAFEPTQIKSAIGNNGDFDPSNPNILKQGEGAPRATLNFASDITQAPSVIALLEGADLSSFLHESGHFFLEVQADLAARIQLRMSFGDTVSEAERGIVTDMNTLLAWFGVTDMPEASALDQWAMKTLEERRDAHETFARGFERYAMEGKAPTQELAGLFNKFRSWLVSIYQKLANLNVTLTDDVRGVMDRMLASNEAIAEAQAARNMGPLFQSPEQAGMTPKEYDTYQFLGERATAAASEELDARLMKDMKWLSRAKSKAIKAAQEEAAQIRRDTEIEVRREVMAQPIYQAWQILTGKGLTAEDRLAANKKRGKSNTLNPAVDNLFEAIANLGGLDKAQVQAAWGVEDKLESGLFGKPVLRVEGGRSIEGMIERLVEEGYILPGRNGMTDAEQFEALFDDQRRGVDRYSVEKEYNASQEDAPIEGVDLTNRFAKLNTTELQRRYGMKDDAVWRILSERRMTNDTGLDPDLLAESIPGGGFTSGDELVRKLAAAPPPAQVIAEQTDQLMMERYGDITSAEALSQAADEAVHNELRARVIATELKALQKAGQVLTGDRNTTSVLARAAKEYAAQVIARQRVRDLRPSQYTAAEARSAKLAEQALGKDMAEAALHKRNQLINNYAARAAYDAQDEVKAMQAYFRKFDKRRDSIDAGYQDQIEALLERFDFKPASLKAIDKRKSFAAWYEEQAAGDNPPDVPEYLLDEAGRKSYKDMTVEELRGLRDTVKQIEHQGRLKNKLLLARDQRDFDAAATAMANSIVENGGEVRPVQLEGPNPVTDWFAGVAASHRKLASLFRQMDGNKDDGPMYDLIGRGMNERGTMEDVMVEKATVALRDIYAPLMKMRGGITGARSKLYIPEINASLTRGGRLAVALNWGNEANRQRIMDGDKWSAGQVQAILKTLTPVELKFVNDVWAYIDSYWPEIAAKEKRLTGVEPEKVVAQPFAQMAADGTEVQMTGGYYPLKYDTDRSDRADTQEAAQAAKEMMQGVMTRSTTRRGHTKDRLKEVKRAVRKDLNVVTQHITQVTHDLAWHEWLIDTNKLLKDERVVSAIRDYYGPKVLKTIRDDVLGIATADVVPQDSVDKALMTLRGNVTRATMGASITTAFLQPFGLTQSMVRIGPQHVLRGLARWGGDAARMENSVEWIRGKSEFMRLRAKTFNKELREIRGSVAGKSATMRVVDAGLFALMQKMQLVADVPTWIGQYEKSMAEGLDEAAAVAMADRAVLESQGGGATKDLAEVQRKHPMLTQFYSYFSVTLNLAAEQTAATNFKNPAAVAGWLGDMALLMVIPAILPALIMHALKGGGDEEEGWPERIAKWQLGYLMGTIVGVRELSGAVSGFDYAGPPVGRIIADIGKAGKQTAQGEVDEPAVMAYIRLMGTAFGIPTVQAIRSYKGWKAWDEGQEGAGPQSVLFGPPPQD